MTRIKICGITRLEDGLIAAAAGADALGFVFYPPSPRYVGVEQAAEIIVSLPPFVTSTALFVDQSADEVTRIIGLTGVDLLQFHGDESPEFCTSFGPPWIKALRMKPGLDLVYEIERYRSARGILLDAYRPGIPGGTGEAFDWEQIPAALASQIILAGGLTVENVGRAVQQVRPWAVDVSGGVEAAKGIKDPERVRGFIAAVKAADGVVSG